LVATQDDRIIGFAQVGYTTQKEAGSIGNVHVQPENRSSGIEEALIIRGIDQIRQCGTTRILVTVSTMRQELIQTLANLGFRKYLELEGMFLEVT